VDGGNTFPLEIAGGESVLGAKLRLLKERSILPSWVSLSFCGVELEDGRDILSYAIPSGCSIDYTIRPTEKIDVEHEGRREIEHSSRSTVENLALMISSESNVRVEDVVLESGENELPLSTRLSDVASLSVKVILTNVFVLESAFGPLTTRLRKTATLGDVIGYGSQLKEGRSPI
jgi:hypothetical protein